VSRNKEWVQLELWTDEEDNVGWKILAHQNDTLKVSLLQQALCEMTEWWMDPTEENPVVYTLMMHRDGFCHSRPSTSHDFSVHREFTKLRYNAFRSHWLLVNQDVYPSWIREKLWSLEWLWCKVTGRFKASQKAAQPAARAVPATVSDMVYAGSEGSEAASQYLAPNVVPISRARKRDDIRPL
jgi:hypothetical protein